MALLYQLPALRLLNKWKYHHGRLIP